MTQISSWLGIVGAILLALNFVLASRLFFFNRLYHYHHLVGITAFFLISSHVFLKIYSFGLSLNFIFGPLAFISLLLLILLSTKIRLAYHLWYRTHQLAILPLIFLLGHLFYEVGSSVWLYSILFLALIAYIYKAFLYSYFGPRYRYRLSSIKQLNQITELYLRPATRPLSFRPGQFVFVKIGSETHPFSFSSSPATKQICLSIKNLGDFTNQLSHLETGTPVNLYGPYGNFGAKFFGSQDVVAIAGGIGITPFLSMLSFEVNKPLTRHIHLYYCVSDSSQAVYLPYLRRLAKKIPYLHLTPHYSATSGHFTASGIINLAPLFFICGPPSMMTSLVSQLITHGVPRHQIIVENFSIK